MSEQANIALVRQCYDAFLAGDVQKLLSLMSPDVEWTLPDVSNIEFSGRRKGRDSVAEFFSLVGASQQLVSFEPREFFASGDRVVVLGHYDWIIRANGADFSSDWAHVFTVRGGVVHAFSEMVDTLKASECYGKSAPAAVRQAGAGAQEPVRH